MEKLSKTIYNIIVFLLLLITIVITMLWINNSNLLYRWYFYIIWGVAIIVGGITYLYGKKNSISKVAEIFLLILSMFLSVLLLSTFLIYLITSSMP